MTSGSIRDVRVEDSARICEIYNYYVESTSISFEEEPVPQQEMARRIEAVSRNYPWLVYESDGEVLGYAYLSRWKERSAYRYTAETSVYVAKGHTGEGIGTALMQALLERVKKLEVHALIAVIALPNEKSVALHEKFGFKKAAHFAEVGFKHNAWINVGYWELVL
ncbi:MAG: arsinothricin resistance N-acetyltransferase ArsN1 family B [Rectinema sp.]